MTKLIPSLLFLWSQGASATSCCVCCRYDACYCSGERMHSMGEWFKCNLFCARWDEMSSTKQHHPVKSLLSFWVSAADCSVQIHLSCNYHLMVESPFICCNITSHASRVASSMLLLWTCFSSATFKRVIFCFLFLFCLKGCFILLICNVYYVLVKVLNTTLHLLLPHPLK